MFTKTAVMESVLLTAYKFLETLKYFSISILFKYINLGFKAQILEQLFFRIVPLAVSNPCGTLVDNNT